MIRNENSSTPVNPAQKRSNESGAALATALLMLAILSAVTLSVLAVVRTETRIAGSDLKRTQTFYAAAAGIEKMTSDFSALFQRTTHPTAAQMTLIQNSWPTELGTEGYNLSQTLAIDDVTLAAMRTTQNIAAPAFPSAIMGSDSPFAGLNASVNPYTMTTKATNINDGTQVSLTRQMNNYMIPIFQFGVFSDKDLEFWPEPPMTFNGRIHSNGNIYFGGDATFLQRVTTAGEAVRGKLRNNATNDANVAGYFPSNPRWKLANGTVKTMSTTQASVINGPNVSGNYPGSPTGTANAWWVASSKSYYGQLLLSKSTGVLPLKLPLQLQDVGKQPIELIKRSMPDDTLAGFEAVNQSRYQTKAEIRILIDDEDVGNGSTNAAGIGNDSSGVQKGVKLSQFNPLSLDNGKALRPVTDAGAYLNNNDWNQGDPGLSPKLVAETVRGVRNDYAGLILAATSNAATLGNNATSAQRTVNNGNAAIPKSPDGAIIPPGAGIKGRILIEIVPPPASDGTVQAPIDVTSLVLSMGMTVGEPNAIVQLQRPQWAAFLQGGRERKGGNWFLNYFMDTTSNTTLARRALADGEIKVSAPFNPAGFLASVTDDLFDDDNHPSGGGNQFTPNSSSMARDDKPPSSGLNRIVPINVYNVREGRMDESLSSSSLYQRGITSVIDINMRNLARWVSGVYDSNLLQSTNAVSSNIDGADGFTVYISDRRGDRIKNEKNQAGNNIATTNGLVDNEDIYNYGLTTPTLDPGEDVIDDGVDAGLSVNKKGSLQLDKCELPSPAVFSTPGDGSATPTGVTASWNAATSVNIWNPAQPASMASTGCSTNNYWFRRAVRVSNGENLIVPGFTRLSTTKGITIASENMVYVWGNFNTTGINQAPITGESSLDDPAATSHYNGNQVPASIVGDAIFPLSKTWYDALPAMYPAGDAGRIADAGATTDLSAITVAQETSVRAAFIAGATLSAMVGTTPPTYGLDWLNGGVHNFPRFLETWSASSVTREQRWNYTGSFIILYNSTQALGPWGIANNVVYSPPTRNWSFDVTFTDPNRLPPGTPQFQHVEPTGFRESLY